MESRLNGYQHTIVEFVGNVVPSSYTFVRCLAVRDSLSDVEGDPACVLEENKPMKPSRLPQKIAQRLRKEALAWDRASRKETDGQVTALLEKAEVFRISRPPREPVSVRLDPQDIFLLKRLARRKGVPSSQLIALWVHERVVREAKREAG